MRESKIYTLLFLVVAGFTSCTKDPDIPEGLKSLEKLGGWVITSPIINADLPFQLDFDGRSNATVAMIGNSAYILGSSAVNNSTINQSCWKYDMDANTLDYIAGIPEAFGGAIAFGLEGKIYYGTGFNGSGELSNKIHYTTHLGGTSTGWNVLSGTSVFSGAARSGAVSFVIDNRAYVGLGNSASGYLKDFYSFNPSTQKWTKIADMPGAGRQDACAFVLNGKAYVGTGYNGTYLNDMWQYDPVTNVWTRIADLPGVGRDDAVAFAFDKRGYVGTGWNQNTPNRIMGDFWEYNPLSNVWMASVVFNGARYGAIAWTLGNTAYVGCGNDNATDLNDIWKSTVK
ncbi:MAG: kelch repeat-containing protein [Bacteroidota bacterium]